MAVLIDTSAASLFFRRRRRDLAPAEEVVRLHVRELLASGEALLAWPVLQELLSGVRPESRYRELEADLRSVGDAPLGRADYERAARLFNVCAAQGVGASYFDMLICAVAERLAVPVYTLDSDFHLYRDLLGIQLFEP